MHRQIRRFEVTCDGCGTVTFCESFDKSPPVPKGWTREQDPREHWIAQPSDYCDRCRPTIPVEHVRAESGAPLSVVDGEKAAQIIKARADATQGPLEDAHAHAVEAARRLLGR